MSLLIHYQCKYCGARTSRSSHSIPLKTKCPKRRPAGTHVWVKVD